MSILVLTSDTLIGTAAAGNIEYNGQFYGTDSAASRAQMQRITQGTAVASTSGTSIDFTGLPAWVKRITVIFNGVSTNGSSAVQIQLGAGSVTTTGYTSGSTSGSTNVTSTTGLLVTNSTLAANLTSGSLVLNNISGNTWVSNGVVYQYTSYGTVSGGVIALGGTLDRVRITTFNGTDTFDAGTVNILYEG